MNSSARKCGLTAACLFLLGVAALWAGDTSASAASCSNEAIRIQQGSTYLPECRAYELVSQADKNQNQVGSGLIPALGHEEVLYSVHGGLPGSSSGNSVLIARRTPAGWTSRSILPPRAEMVTGHYLVRMATADLSTIFVSAYDGLGTGSFATTDSLVRLDGLGGQQLLHTLPFGKESLTPIVSADGARVYASVREPLDPSHVTGTNNIYDFGAVPPRLVSLLPGETGAPTCGTMAEGEGGNDFGGASTRERWISADGRLILFASRGESCATQDPLHLYARDLDAGVTRLLSGPPLAGADRGIVQVLGLNASETSVLFLTDSTLQALDSADGDDGDGDVYRYSLATATATCVTCILPNADVGSPSSFFAAGMSDTGGQVYFLSPRAALPGAVEGKPNVYVAAGDDLGFAGVATWRWGISSTPATSPSEVSPDGRLAIFVSDDPQMNALTAGDNGGKLQLYRYDAAAESIACVSCPPDESAAQQPVWLNLILGPGRIKPDLRAMSDDGRSIVFATAEALVAEDVDGAVDIYVWRDGEPGLLTDGGDAGVSESAPKPITMSPSGRDVFFEDIARLTPEASDDVYKIYNARIGGGFPGPTSPPEPCAGDACRGAIVARPPALAGASAAFIGTGNLKSRRLKKRRKHCRRKARTKRGRGAKKQGTRKRPAKRRCNRRRGARGSVAKSKAARRGAKAGNR